MSESNSILICEHSQLHTIYRNPVVILYHPTLIKIIQA